MRVNDFNWKIGGPAGYGIKVTGAIFSKVCVRGGLYAFGYIEYPSLIRGGHNTYQLKIKDREVHCQERMVNLLVALNQETVALHQAELAQGSGLIYDHESHDIDEKMLKSKGVLLFPIPLKSIATECGGGEVMRNTVALGATLALVGYDIGLLKQLLKEKFGEKGKDIVEKNVCVAQKGFDYVVSRGFDNNFPYRLEKREIRTPRVIVGGNDALSLGIAKAGCKFYVAYPMTPSTSILHTLAAWGPQYGMVVRHAEDEIGVINMAQGAAAAGARAACATSGGGFALMNEGLSLAGMTETPLVVIVVMRSGPATGLPTWTEQGDIQYVLHAGHGEFPRIVIAPGDPQEAYQAAFDAFNLAEKYQTPVIVLSDKYMSESFWSLDGLTLRSEKIERGKILSEKELKDIQYHRYKFTPDGISPRIIPGDSPAVSFINSDEHDEYGFSEESARNRIQMVNKRFLKLHMAETEMPAPLFYGEQNADITLVGFGSVKRPVIEALARLSSSGKKVNFLHFTHIYPFPYKKVRKAWERIGKWILIEQNATGQFGAYLKEKLGVEPHDALLKYDGRPFYPEEIVEKMKKI